MGGPRRRPDHGAQLVALGKRVAAVMGNDDAVRDGNNALAAGDITRVSVRLAEVRAMLEVLGLDPLAEPWVSRGPDDDLHSVVSALVSVALAQRQAARERGDYATADGIRDELHTAGVVIEDTPNGPRWELKQ